MRARNLPTAANGVGAAFLPCSPSTVHDGPRAPEPWSQRQVPRQARRIARGTPRLWAAALGLMTGGMLLAADANRLTYLDENDPFYPGLTFPKLTTPQWVGEPGVEAVVILSIDDLREPSKYEVFLRPILDRLQQIDGRAPLSIFCNALDPRQPLFQKWLQEGVSLEVHTLSHPCPLLAKGNFLGAKQVVYGGIEQLNQIPGNQAVAFRMPCCDSINSPSPRFYAEIFNRTNEAGQFLTADSSVMNMIGTNDPALPRELVLDADGKSKFGKYLPFRSFVTTVSDYPYPYVIGKLCWEFPAMVPSDWEAQHLHGTFNPVTVADWKAALDVTVIKQGVFTLVFHPHAWIRNDQVVELIDYAVRKHGPRVKFLSLREAQQRLNQHLLASQPLRAANGQDNGVRLLDLNHDGYLDVVVGNERARLTRVWEPKTGQWRDHEFPTQLVNVSADGQRHEAGARFGVVQPDGHATCWLRDEKIARAWHFGGENWIEDQSLLAGLELAGQPVLTSQGQQDRGVRFRDVNGDGRCEAIVGNPSQNAVFGWSPADRTWNKLAYALPSGTAIVDAEGRDNGLRFVDVNEDGYADVMMSNNEAFALRLFVAEPFLGFLVGWSRNVMTGKRGDPGEIAPIVLGTPPANNGAWFHSRTLWVQNENTAHLPELVDRRTYGELLGGLKPPPLSPAESLSSMRLRAGFKIELVAAEPLVKDPVAFDWSADGRLWVVAMGDYPLGVDNAGKPGGVVWFLEDADGDGRYDRSTVFLEHVNFPNGVVAWKRGVIVSAAPEIFYAEDTDGDGKADLRKTLFSGFGQGNQQHRVNIADYGLDNWFYGGNGDSGGTILSLATGKKVGISGRDFRFRPEDGAFETQAGQTQFGRHRDDWGNWFANNNPTWGWHFFLPENYLARNPHLAVKTVIRHFAQYPEATRVHYISRKLQRYNDVGAENYVTSACSAMPYRDDLFGPAFTNNLFICEPVYNVIHREILEPDGVTFSSHRAPDEQDREFLASTDNWFRPVFLKTGPDGALYIADMYRLVIEHPEWIPKDTMQRIDVRAGENLGRIYRVFPDGATLRPVPRLDRLDTAGLAGVLASPNGWQRDAAQRLLVERQDPAAVPLLQSAWRQGKLTEPKSRLQALGALDGLGGLTPAILMEAAKDPHPAVREHAVRWSEPFLRQASAGSPKAQDPNSAPAPASPTEVSQLGEALLKLVPDPELRVSYQLALSLGEWKDPRASEALTALALRYPDSEPLQTAVMTSATSHVREMLGALMNVPGAQPPPARLLEQLLGLAAALKDDPALARGLSVALRLEGARYATLQFTALAGLLDTLDRRNLSLTQFQQESSEELKQSLRQSDKVFALARQIAADPQAEGPQRLAAIRVLGRGLGDPEADLTRLGELLQPHQPSAIQQAALAGLKRGRGPRVATILLAGWRSYSPYARANVLDVLFTRLEWVRELIATFESGQLEARDLNATYQQKLLTHADSGVRERARRSLSAVNSDRQAVVDVFQSVAHLKGEVDCGAEVFRQNCAVCHRLQGQGNAVGPDLAALTDKSAPAMVLGILDPNRVVEDKYINYTAVTKTDREVSGIITSETATSITMRLAGGAEEVLLRGDLTELTSSKLSLMPEGFENNLKPQDLADMIAFINASGPPPKSFLGNQPQVIKPDAAHSLRLLAANAEIYGDSLVFEPHYRNLGFWQSESDRAVWSVELPAGGVYDLWMDWAAPGGGTPNHFRFEGGGARLAGTIPPTGTWDDYQQARLGSLELKAGPHRLVFRGQPPLHGAIIDLRELRLIPAGRSVPADFKNVKTIGESAVR